MIFLQMSVEIDVNRCFVQIVQTNKRTCNIYKILKVDS